VTRHVEALAGELIRSGHDVRVFAPFDHDTRRTALLHRGARPQPRVMPEWLVPLGGTIGWSANGAVSNISLHPYGVSTLRRELRAFDPDVVHLQEPIAPTGCYDLMMACDHAPMVGTFHTYSTRLMAHYIAAFGGHRRRMNRLAVRIAVSEAAAWTGRRFHGGEYRIIPNGVHLPPGGVPAPRPRDPEEPLRIAFVGQAVERKGLPVLMRAFEGLRRQIPATLTIVGAGQDEVAPLLVDGGDVTALGRVGDETRHAVLLDSDVLVAPSLGGESFGMVLTEAFAAGTPVVASDIAGYRDVVSDGEDGLLFGVADAQALAETLRELALQPELTERLAEGAARSAERYAWPHVASQVEETYAEAVSLPQPQTASERVAARYGLVPAGGVPRRPARRIPPLDPRPSRPRVVMRVARRAAVVGAGALAVGTTVLALQHIGTDSIVRALVRSSPFWVLAALAFMCGAMFLRAVAWHAILKGALASARPRYADALQGTSIGVLMSATLPARLGEPARALVVARRLGRPRERLPVVLGTLVSQTLLNVLALVLLGAVMFGTIGLFAGRQQALVWYAIGPLLVVAAVLVAPALLRSGLPSRSARLHRWVMQARRAAARVRSGLAVFRSPRLGATAVTMQLGAWAMQWVSCYLLLVALGLDRWAGIGAAAGVLFAVNVSAVLPVTPSNIGVFQAACVAVLSGAYGVRAADALGYGIILQAVEVATAFIMGAPALVREGMSWRDLRLRTLNAAPVVLAPRRAPALEER
jgi:phosphatidylinositol alpha-mannosyltransferase